MLNVTAQSDEVLTLRNESGDPFLTPSVSRKTSNPVRKQRMGSDAFKKIVAHLTSREVAILQLIAESHANKQIAAMLEISIKTVEKHRHNLMLKLDVHDTAGLTRLAIFGGIVKSDVRLVIV